MFETLRKQMKYIIWAITLLFVSGLFVWYGQITGDHNNVARVNRTPVTINDFNDAYTRELMRRREEREEEISDMERNRIREEVLSSLVYQQAKYQQALQMGISATEEEVISAVTSLPQFQREGQFDMEIYRHALRSSGYTPSEFEKTVKKDLTVRKLERLILSSSRATINEMKMKYLSEHGSLDDFEENKSELRTRIMQDKRNSLYGNWMQSLYRNYDIEIFPENAGLQS